MMVLTSQAKLWIYQDTDGTEVDLSWSRSSQVAARSVSILGADRLTEVDLNVTQQRKNLTEALHSFFEALVAASDCSFVNKRLCAASDFDALKSRGTVFMSRRSLLNPSSHLPSLPAPTVAHGASCCFLSKQEDVMGGCEHCGRVSGVLALHSGRVRGGSVTMGFLANTVSLFAVEETSWLKQSLHRAAAAAASLTAAAASLAAAAAGRVQRRAVITRDHTPSSTAEVCASGTAMEDTITCSHATFSQVFGRQGQLMQA
ncbi:unnamed protein product, partial [Pleuronectes platessa]